MQRRVPPSRGCFRELQFFPWVYFHCNSLKLSLNFNCMPNADVSPSPLGMKRPLSPSNLPGSSIRGGFQESPGVGSPAEQRLKKEKKHPSFTLCEVCNIQLNSAVQAQIHYNGKSHQKRLKQLSKSKVLPSQGKAQATGSASGN